MEYRSILAKKGYFTVDGTVDGDGGRLNKLCKPFLLKAGAYYFRYTDISPNLDVLLENSSDNSIVSSGGLFTLDEDTNVYVGLNLVNGRTYDNKTLQVWLNENEDKGFSEVSYYTKINVKDDSIDKSVLKGVYRKVDLRWKSGNYLGKGGLWVENAYYSYSDIELLRGQTIYVRIEKNNDVQQLSVWSKDNKLLKVIDNQQSEEAYRDYEYTCMSNTEILRLCCETSKIKNVVASIKDIDGELTSSISDVDENDYLKVLFENVICIGDSLTQGSYTGSDLHQENYPYFLSKLTGWNCTNAGRAGWTTLEWWNGSESEQKGFPYNTYADKDTAIIFLGTNNGLTDTLDTDVEPYSSYDEYANTNTGAYCKIIDGIKAQNPNIKIYLCTIFAGGGDSLDTTNQVIRKIAERYDGLSVIDLNISEFNIARTAYHALANIHLGRIGYAKLASKIKNALVNDVLEKVSVHNYIPTN